MDVGPTVYTCSPRPPAHALGTMAAGSGQEAKTLFFPAVTLLVAWRGVRWAS